MKKRTIFFLLFILTVVSYSQGAFRVTILYDNYVHTRGTRSDWGFSCLVEGETETILFDTGTRPHILAGNAGKLKIGLKQVRKVLISHNHQDHFGGLPAVLRGNRGVTVYIPPNLSSETIMKIGLSGGKAIKLRGPETLGSGMRTTGIMGNRIPEQSLILQTGTRNILITGCAHPGIVAIIQRAREITGGDIHVVLGGFHLNGHSESAIRKIITAFKGMGVERVGATHCSGKSAMNAFKEAYEENWIEMGVGRVLHFE